MKTRSLKPQSAKSRGTLRGLLVAMNCGISYIFCYNLRNILSALMPTILKSGDFTESQLGRFGSYMLIFYACGQFINGILGDRLRRPQIMLFLGLFISGACAMLFCLPAAKLLGNLLWAVIGFSLSMLWGPISRIIVETSDESHAATYLTAMALASTSGQFLAYFLAVFAARAGLWRVYLFSGGLCTAVAAVVIYLFVSHVLGKTAEKPPAEDQVHESFLQKLGLSALAQEFRHKYFSLMIAVTMLNGIIKHGVFYWIPTYFSVRLGLGNGIATAVSTIIPIVSILGVLLGLALFRKVKNDIFTLFLLFSITVAAFLLSIFSDTGPYLTVFGMLLGGAAMTSANNLIFSAYCLRFKAGGHVSGISGFLDAACYLASAIANLVFTFTISNIGWDFTVITWIVFAVCGVGLSFLADRFAGSETEYS